VTYLSLLLPRNHKPLNYPRNSGSPSSGNSNLSVITLIRRDPEASKIRLIVEIIVSGRSNVSCRV
jgi:hypothetical protein